MMIRMIGHRTFQLTMSPRVMPNRISAKISVPVTERLSVVVGGRADGYWGATNAGSPLFRSDTGFSVAAGLSWSFYRSERMVDSSVEPFD